MHTLNKTGLAQTTKPHQKGLTTSQLQKGANNPLKPEKVANYTQHLKMSFTGPQLQKEDKHTPNLTKG